MPIIRVEVLPGRSREAKQRVATELTQVLVREFGVEADHVYVMFHEHQPGDWAVGGRFFDAPATAKATSATTTTTATTTGTTTGTTTTTAAGPGVVGAATDREA